jgi:hypothetical protein
MNRALLALLAILTGVLAQVAPVQARIVGVGGTEINATEGARAGDRQSATRQTAARPQVARQAQRSERTSSVPPRKPVFIPAVLLGTDRALE